MKKLVVLGFFSIFLSASAFGQFKFGAGVSLELVDLFGISGKAHYTVNEDFAGQASFSYFFEDFTVWALDLDVHYSGFDIGDVEGFSLTPFAGLQVGTISVDLGGFGDASNTDIGLNIGIAGVIAITDSLDLFIEPKLTIGGLEGVFLSGGVYFGGGGN